MFAGSRFPETLARVEALKHLCRPYFATLAEAAMRYVLHAEAVRTVIPGMTDRAQVDMNIRCSDGAPSPQELADAIAGHKWVRNYYRERSAALPASVQLVKPAASTDNGGGEFLNRGVLAANVKDHFAVVHHDMAIAYLKRMVQVVCHEDARNALGLQLTEVGKQRFGGPHREGGRGLIKHQQGAFEVHGSGDGHRLLLPA